MPATGRQRDQDRDTLTTSRPSTSPKPVEDVLTERVAVIII